MPYTSYEYQAGAPLHEIEIRPTHYGSVSVNVPGSGTNPASSPINPSHGDTCSALNAISSGIRMGHSPLQLKHAIDAAQASLGNRATLAFSRQQYQWFHAQAQQGFRDTPQAFPFQAQIQQAFGPEHDISGLTAYTGPAARAANVELGSDAYHKGGQVAFGDTPTLQDAAHEAAHYIQNLDATQLKGGVGETNDVYEQHADRVAEAVTKGESAVSLLDQVTSGAGSSDSGGTTAPLQMTGGRLFKLSGGMKQLALLGRRGISSPADEPAHAVVTMHKGSVINPRMRSRAIEDFHMDIETKGIQRYLGRKIVEKPISTNEDIEIGTYQEEDDVYSDADPLPLRTHFLGDSVNTTGLFQSKKSHAAIPLTDEGVRNAQEFQRSEMLKKHQRFDGFGQNCCDMHALRTLVKGAVKGADLGERTFNADIIPPTHRQAFWLTYGLDVDLWSGGRRWPGGVDPILREAYIKIVKKRTHIIHPDALHDPVFFARLQDAVARDWDARLEFFKTYAEMRSPYSSGNIGAWKDVPNITSETEKVLLDHMIPTDG